MFPAVPVSSSLPRKDVGIIATRRGAETLYVGGNGAPGVAPRRSACFDLDREDPHQADRPLYAMFYVTSADNGSAPRSGSADQREASTACAR